MHPTVAITIHVPGPLRTYCEGAAQLSISADTVRAALEDLQWSQSALYRNVCDETGSVRRHLNVFVNSDNVRDLDGVDTTLTNSCKTLSPVMSTNSRTCAPTSKKDFSRPSVGRSSTALRPSRTRRR